MVMRVLCIDWETMGLEEDAPLLCLGYVSGDTATGDVYATNEIIVPKEYNVKYNRPYDLSTILWWLDQAAKSSDLQSYIISTLRRMELTSMTDLAGDLHDLSQHITTKKLEGIFCTDKNFDFLFYKQILRDCCIPMPFTYRQIFETRYWQQHGAKEVFENTKSEGVSHRAEDDAMWLFRALSVIIP